MADGALEGKVAIVTGSGSGIGAATAERFIDEGAFVVVADRDGDAAANVANRLGKNACAMQSDHTMPNSNAHVVEQTLARFGHLDILHNNAGVLSRASLEHLEVEQLRSIMEANLIGPFLMSKACIPALRAAAKAKRSPCILFTASIQTLMVRAGFSAYGASKHGVGALASTLALELAPDGIRVNAVCPGPVRTPLFQNAAATSGSVGPSIDQIIAGVPLGRLIEAREVACAAVFLCSDKASAITGVLLPVDGGITAR